jgi:hypothetical protein
MPKHIVTLLLPADRRWLTVAELPDLLTDAVQSSPPQPAIISAIHKVELRDGQPIRRLHGLSSAESELLFRIWGIRADNLIGTPAAHWQGYLQRFRGAPECPGDWEPSASIHGGAHQQAVLKAIAREQHQQHLEQAIAAGQLTTLDPISYLPRSASEANSKFLVTVAEFSRYAATLGIEVSSMEADERAQTDGGAALQLTRSAASDPAVAPAERGAIPVTDAARATNFDLPPATADEIIVAFKIREQPTENSKVWKRMMRDAKRNAWLLNARVMTGRNSRQSLWRPELIATGIPATLMSPGKAKAGLIRHFPQHYELIKHWLEEATA